MNAIRIWLAARAPILVTFGFLLSSVAVLIIVSLVRT
jgi:hypothetical protein